MKREGLHISKNKDKNLYRKKRRLSGSPGESDPWRHPRESFTALQQYGGKDSVRIYPLPLVDRLESCYTAADREKLRTAATEFCR